MRPHCDRAQAAILRAVATLVRPFGVQLVIEELRARDWASLTLAGVRHELDVRLDGPGAAAALAAVVAQLPHENISIRGYLLAELLAEPGLVTEQGAVLTLLALVIND